MFNPLDWVLKFSSSYQELQSEVSLLRRKMTVVDKCLRDIDKEFYNVEVWQRRKDVEAVIKLENLVSSNSAI